MYYLLWWELPELGDVEVFTVFVEMFRYEYEGIDDDEKYYFSFNGAKELWKFMEDYYIKDPEDRRLVIQKFSF